MFFILYICTDKPVWEGHFESWALFSVSRSAGGFQVVCEIWSIDVKMQDFALDAII